MIMFSLPTKPPKGAVVMFTGKAEELSANFYKRYGMDAPNWKVEDGVATPQKSDLSSKQEFGDCVVHAEFRCPTEGGGNSGIGLHGRYEVQINNSYGKKPEAHEIGALYSQKAALVNASKKVGEWQTYDIIFRAPRFDANNTVMEKPRATVFLNGVLVQNNEEFTGMTGIQFSQYKDMAKTGRL